MYLIENYDCPLLSVWCCCEHKSWYIVSRIWGRHYFGILDPSVEGVGIIKSIPLLFALLFIQMFSLCLVFVVHALWWGHSWFAIILLGMAVVTMFKTGQWCNPKFPTPQFHLAIQFLTKFNENIIWLSYFILSLNRDWNKLKSKQSKNIVSGANHSTWRETSSDLEGNQ